MVKRILCYKIFGFFLLCLQFFSLTAESHWKLYAKLIALNALESVIINSQTEYFGLRSASEYTPRELITHNLACSFPTICKIFGLNVDKQLSQGPIVYANSLKALSLFGGSICQNYLLLRRFNPNQNSAERVRDATLISCGGYIAGWTAYFVAAIISTAISKSH